MIWLTLNIVFNAIFLFEALLKIIVMRKGYFKDGANIFDFVLVLLGWGGVIVTIVDNSEGVGSTEARLLRISRIFRVLRFLRVFRLFHAKLNSEKEISMTLAQHMKRMTILISYSKAHLNAQRQLVKYFGGNGMIDEKDEAMLARCILQSLTNVYKALEQAVLQERKMDKTVLQEMLHAMQRKKIMESLESFVMAAHHDGALSARETESMLHPMYHHLTEELKSLHQLTEGIVNRATTWERSDRKTTKKRDPAGNHVARDSTDPTPPPASSGEPSPPLRISASSAESQQGLSSPGGESIVAVSKCLPGSVAEETGSITEMSGSQ
jgi:hypothetical protein